MATMRVLTSVPATLSEVNVSYGLPGGCGPRVMLNVDHADKTARLPSARHQPGMNKTVNSSLRLDTGGER